MKKLWSIVVAAVFLTGCRSEAVLETVDDEWITPVMASPGQIAVKLPEDAVAPVLDSDGQQIYLGEDYDIFLENRSSGDLHSTIRYLTGFDKEALTVMKTSQGTCDRYEFVWTCTGEEGQRLGRGVILDDGRYHYCLSVLQDADARDKDLSRAVCASFTLA